MVTKLGREAF
jgi:hypothetical protein